ncbi:MAG: carboxypeptidase regulatory-like domain-containing protein [Planctomycetaceae bacterium]|nr:carboxypeptidase regulatory-like domain-containing protein [Planctomycetaceae bacterium]
MTIRYTCENCGSVLKIKDDRAGKDGHCPKCKSSFVIPQPGEEPAADADAEVAAPALAAPAPIVAKSAAKAKPAAEPAVAAVAAPAVEDADFDPVAFLMTGKEDGAKGAAAAAKPAKTGGEAADMRAARGAGPAAYSASEEPDVRVGGPRRPTPAEEEDAVPTPSRKPKRAAATAAQTADEMLRVNASSNAKDLLTKTMEESRIRAAQMPEGRKKPGIDYMAAIKDLTTQYAFYIGGFVVLLVGAYFLGNLMSNASTNLPALGQVNGTLTKAGEPLADAMVTFIPVDTKANASTAYTDQDGYFELKYVEGVPGAVLGKNRVEVSLVAANGRELLRPGDPYGMGSKVIETVKEGSQTINIAIP